MLSWPPARMTSGFPASSMSWASIAAFMPEPHILLSVTAPALSGSPPLNAAWRAGAWPWPAIRQLPINTSPTVSGARPARASAARMATPPRSWAARSAKSPCNDPMGVRAAPTMTMGSWGDAGIGCSLVAWLVWRIVALPARAAPVHAGAGVLTAAAAPAPAPGIEHDRGLRDMGHLLDGIELAEHVVAPVRGDGRDQLPVAVAHILHMANPVVGQPDAGALQRRAHAAAAIVADHHQLRHIHLVDGVLDGGQAVQIGVRHHIRHIAVHEHFARLQARDLVGRNAAVRAADPHVLGLLLRQQAGEEPGPLALHPGRPG